jgi:hypothetical protein
LHDADAALLQSNAAITRGAERSSQYFVFREATDSLIRSVEAGSDFILVSFHSEDRVRRETALPAAKMDNSNFDSPGSWVFMCAELARFGRLGVTGRNER